MPTKSKTFKLDDLKLSDMNRVIQRPHVDRLKRYIEKYGYIKGFPIIADKEGNIIDGQHRYLACKELNIEPDIIISDQTDLMPTINASQLKWRIADYVNYYATKGIPDYIILKEICQEFNLSPSMVLNIYLGRTTQKTGLSRSSGGMEGSPIKAGAFRFKDTSDKGIDKLKRKIKAILSLISALELPKTDKLLIAIVRISEDKNFHFQKMYSKLDYMKARVHKCSTINEYIAMLSFIYNYRNSTKVSI